MNLNEFMGGFEPPPEEDFSPIPEGKYITVVDNVAIEQNDKKQSFAKVTYKVEGPTHANRLVWDNCWLTHSNPKANVVGKSRLHKLATTIGIDATNSSCEDYIGKRVEATIAIDAYNPKYNRIKGVAKVPDAPASLKESQVVEGSEADTDAGEEDHEW